MNEILSSQSEAQIKAACCQWLTLYNYEWTRVQSGNLVVVAGKHARRCIQCAKPGTADVLVVLPPSGYALWLEFKSHSKSARQSPEQVEFAARMAKLGAGYRIVRGVDDLIAAMREEAENAKVPNTKDTHP